MIRLERRGKKGNMPTIGGERDTRLEGGRDAKQLADIAACSILPVRNKKGTRTTVEIPD